jgi:hypothetical protein
MAKSDSMSRHRSFRLTSDQDADGTMTAISLRNAFYLTIVEQLVLLLLAALILDGGMIFRRVIVATTAFWCFVLLLLIRRASRATAGDILFIKFGIWPLIAVATVMTIILGRF